MPTIRRAPLHALLAAAALASACGAAPPPAPPPPAAGASAAPVAPAPAAPAPPEVPARWIFTDGIFPRMGPESAAGQLVIVGGRRVLIAKDETARWESAPAPEPLEELVYVPTAAGPRLVGRGAEGLYRFDDPLGEAVPIARGPICRTKKLLAFPGLVVVRCSEDGRSAHFIDVETGAVRRPPGLPNGALVDAAFRDMHEGAALVGEDRLLLTRDGGATWKPMRAPLPMFALAVHDGRLIADVGGPQLWVPIDVAAGTVGARFPFLDVHKRQVQMSPHPFLARIRDFLADGDVSFDPIAHAIVHGAAAPDGAWVALRGSLLRLDLRTGEYTPAAALPAWLWRSQDVAWAGEGLWILGEGQDDQHKPLTSVVRATRTGDTWTFGPREPVELKDRWGAPSRREIRTAPGGGVMASARVRQPDGTWRDVSAIATACAPRTVSPLADGRVACLAPRDPGGEIQIVIVEASGDVQRSPLPGLRAPAEASDQEAILEEAQGFPSGTAVEEGRDHVLRFVVKDSEGFVAVAVPLAPAGAPARVTRIPGAVRAALRRGHGLAVGGGKLLASTDGGATWGEIPVPPRARPSIERVQAGKVPFVVSDTGAVLGLAMRIGWGAGTAPEPLATASSAPIFDPHAGEDPRVPFCDDADLLRPATGAPSADTLRSCTTVGEALYKGKVIAEDANRAAFLFQYACIGGELRACVDMGWAQATGTGTAKDGAAAAASFGKACTGATTSGCLGLGLLYREGNGVPKDAARAAALLDQACKGGNPDACSLRRGRKP